MKSGVEKNYQHFYKFVISFSSIETTNFGNDRDLWDMFINKLNHQFIPQSNLSCFSNNCQNPYFGDNLCSI
jgi:hypothetical protein